MEPLFSLVQKRGDAGVVVTGLHWAGVVVTGLHWAEVFVTGLQSWPCQIDRVP